MTSNYSPDELQNILHHAINNLTTIWIKIKKFQFKIQKNVCDNQVHPYCLHGKQ